MTVSRARSVVMVAAITAAAASISLRARAEPPHGASGAVPAPTPSDAPQPSQPPPSVKLPVLKHNDGAAYPRQALLDGVHGPVIVSLILEIDATGIVKSATVKTPVGHGFDEAAVAAAQSLTFEPATRAGAPFAIRISFDYLFTPPPGALAGRIFARDTGAPLTSATVVARAGDKTYSARVDAQGRWRIADLPSGSYTVSIASDGFAAEQMDQAVSAGAEVDIVQRLTRAKPPPAPAPVPQPPGTPQAPPSPTDTDEVHVTAARPPREVTVRTLEQRELTRIPGTNGDALRSLQNLPGVARPPGLAGLLIVRGSAPQDTSVFVDGTLIPIVYHFGGLSSVVPSEMLEKIDFYPGNFSAQYGRATGGIVDVGIRDPKKDNKFHGMAQVDFIDARVMAEGPIGETGWNYLVAGRRSYVDLWLKPVLEKADAGVSTAPVYYDYQAMVQKDFNSHSSARVLFMGSDDQLDVLIKSVNGSDPSFAGGISTHTGFWRLQGRYINRFSDRTKFVLTSAVGEDFVDFNLGDNFLHVASYPISTRAELQQKIAPGVTANFGLDVMYTPYDVTVRFPPLPQPGTPPPGPFLARPPLESHDANSIFRPGAYAELEMTPWQGGRIVPGIRLDYSKDTESWDGAPRVTVRQDLHSEFPRTTLKGGVGVFYQPPQPQETNAVFGMPGLRSERAVHYDVGTEQDITRNVDVSVDTFYKQLDYLVTERVGNVGTGDVVGLEVLLRYRPDDRFFGWLAYTLSRSERRDAPNTPIHLSPFDQTHILTVLGSYRLGHGWEAGARFRLVSGNPYTGNTYGFYDENGGSYLPLLAYPQDSSRLPIFHQLDVRIDKTWEYSNGRKIGLYLDVQNVYNQGNVEGVSYNYNDTLHSYVTGLPLIPSFGVRGEM